MVSDELVKFMRREFGVSCLKILNDIHMDLNIDDVDKADAETKKRFILALQTYMHDKSFTKSELLISELISILDIAHHFGSEKSNLGDAQISHIKNYIDKEAKNSIKIARAEAMELINIYFSKTKIAELKGISKRKMTQTTKRALIGLRKRLLDSAYTIEEKYNLRTNMAILENKMKETLEIGDVIHSEEIKQQISMLYAVSGYKKRILKLFNELERTFIESLHNKIDHEINGKEAKGIAKYTEIITKDVFERIQNTFNSFQQQILES